MIDIKITKDKLIIDSVEYNYRKSSWREINSITENEIKKNNIIEYLGEGMDDKKQLHCVFRIKIKNNKHYDNGEFITVNNDIIIKNEGTGNKTTELKSEKDLEKEMEDEL